MRERYREEEGHTREERERAKSKKNREVQRKESERVKPAERVETSQFKRKAGKTLGFLLKNQNETEHSP